MSEIQRCYEDYQNRVWNRPFGLSVEEGNRYLEEARNDRDACILAAEAGDMCRGVEKPSRGPQDLVNAGIQFRPEGYKCINGKWVYRVDEDEAYAIQEYQNARYVKEYTARTCKDYSTAVVDGRERHVYDNCSVPYYIDYESNEKVYLDNDWWTTPEGRANTDNYVDYRETHVKDRDEDEDEEEVIVKGEDEETVPTEELAWWDICGKFAGGVKGGEQKACKWYDMICHGENASKRAVGSATHMLCWFGIGVLGLFFLMLLLLGKKGTTQVIVSGAQTAKETTKGIVKR